MFSPQTEELNKQFIAGALVQCHPKNAQLVIALAVTEGGELLITSSNRITLDQLRDLLMEAAAATTNTGGRIIQL